MNEGIWTMTETELADTCRAKQAEALEEVAAYLDKPRVVWYGQGGATVTQKEGDTSTLTPLAEWLRSEAAAYRGSTRG